MTEPSHESATDDRDPYGLDPYGTEDNSYPEGPTGVDPREPDPDVPADEQEYACCGCPDDDGEE